MLPVSLRMLMRLLYYKPHTYFNGFFCLNCLIFRYILLHHADSTAQAAVWIVDMLRISGILASDCAIDWRICRWYTTSSFTNSFRKEDGLSATINLLS